MNVVLAIKSFHDSRVDEDQDDEDVDRSLLSPPESEFEAEKRNLVEFIDEEDAKTEGDQEPD